MTDDAKRIFEAALRLPEAERAVLAVALEDSIGDGAPAEEIDEAWLDEAKRRREEIRSGEAQLVPWQDVRGEMFEMVERARDKSESERQAVG
jgi:putative addiction module component (TIGR02574 family)